jgi:hypothetical protein
MMAPVPFLLQRASTASTLVLSSSATSVKMKRNCGYCVAKARISEPSWPLEPVMRGGIYLKAKGETMDDLCI